MTEMIASHSFPGFMAGYLLAALFLFLLIRELARLYLDYLGAQWECVGVLVEKKSPAFPSLFLLLAGTFLYFFSHSFRRYTFRHPSFLRYVYYLVFEVEGEQRRFSASPELYAHLREGQKYRLLRQGKRLLEAKRES